MTSDNSEEPEFSSAAASGDPHERVRTRSSFSLQRPRCPPQSDSRLPQTQNGEPESVDSSEQRLGAFRRPIGRDDGLYRGEEGFHSEAVDPDDFFKRLVDGDDGAWKVFFREMGGKERALIRLYACDAPPATVLDLLQEARLVLWEDLQERKIKNHVHLRIRYGIVILRVCVDRLRTGRREVPASDYLDARADVEGGDDPLSLTGDLACRLERLEALEACLGKLPKEDQALLEEYYVNDRSAAEVGTARGLSEGAVRIAVHRALKKLRDCLERGSKKGFWCF